MMLGCTLDLGYAVAVICVILLVVVLASGLKYWRASSRDDRMLK
jgi:hypothetical protein